MSESKLGSAYVAIRAQMNELDKDLAKARSSIEKGFGGALQNVGGQMAGVGMKMTAGLTVPILAAGAAVLGVGGQWDEAMDTIQLTTGATGDELKGLGDDVKGVFTSIPTDMATATQAISELNVRTGQTGQGLQELAATEIELARITGGDLGSQIQNTTRLFGDWGIKVSDQVPALDSLMRAHQATGIEVDTLAAKLVQFGAPLRQMGFSFDESAALLGKFEQEGVNSELVLGSLRIALGKFAKAGIEPKEGLQNLIAEIKNAGSTAEANKLAMETFGARAGPDMAAAIREGRFEVGDLFDEIANGKGTVLGAAESTNDYAEKMTLLKNQVIAAAIPLGVTLFDALNKLMPTIEKIIGFVAKLVEWFSNLPSGVQAGILAFLGIVAVAGPIIAALGGIISAVGTVAGLFGAGGALAGIAAAIGGVLAPIIGPILLIVAVVAGLYLAFKNNFLGIRDILTGAWQSIKAIFDFIKGVFSNFMAFLKGEITWEEFLGRTRQSFENLKNYLENIWTQVKLKVAEAWGQVKEILVNLWFAITQAAQAIWTPISDFFTQLWTGIQARATEIWAGISTFFTNIWTTISDFFTQLWTGIQTTATTIWTAISDFFTSILTAIQTTATTIWTAISDFFTSILTAIQTTATTIWTAISDFFTSILTTIQTTATTIWTAISTFITTILTTIQNTVTVIWTAIKSVITTILETLASFIKSTWTAIQKSIDTVLTAIKQVVTTVWTAIKSIIQTILETLAGIITAILLAMQGNFKGAWETIKSTAINLVTGMKDAIVGLLTGLAAAAANAGAGMIQAFADAIVSKARAVLDAVRAIVDEIRALLPGSDAEIGPLSDLTASGRALPVTIGQGVTRGAAAAVAAAERFAGQMDTALAGGQRTGFLGASGLLMSGLQPAPAVAETRQTTNNVTINNPVGEPAETSIVRQLRKLAYIGSLAPAE